MAADHREARAHGDSGEIGPRSADVLPGSLASLDRTLPPTPLRDLLAADGASVFVCSVDVELVRAVEEAGGDQYPIFIVHEWSELFAAVDSGRSKIVLLDLDALPAGLETALAALETVSRTLVVLAAARREEAQTLMALLSDRRIHRLLIKPAAVGITRLLLESSVSRYLQLRELPQAAVVQPLEPAHRRRSTPARPTQWPAWLAATAVVSVLLGAVLVGGLSRFGMPWSDPAPSPADTVVPMRTAALAASAEPASAATTVVESPGSTDVSPSIVSPASTAESASSGQATSAPQEQITVLPPDRFAEQLIQAQQAVAAGRRSQPVGDSALDYYAGVLAADPDHAEAGRQLAALLDALYGEVEAALLDGSLQTASLTLADIERVEPTSGRLSFLKAQLERGLAAETASMAGEEQTSSPSAAPSAQEPDELQSLLTIARTRLQRGQLLTPDGDSARAYLERAAALNPDHPGMLELRNALAEAVTSSARAALDRDDPEEAALLTQEAFALGADRETLALLEIDLAAAREGPSLERQAELLAAARARLQGAQLIAPAQDSALYFLSELRDENPDHPELALQWRQFADSVAANTRRAIASSDWQAAQTLVIALEGAGVDAALAGQLEYESQQAQFLATPAPLGALRLLESQPLAYPADALRSQLEGWVDLDLIVDTDGRTRAISVIESEPARRFDDAAIEAVSRQRYEPFELDGRRYERRLRFRIRFVLD